MSLEERLAENTAALTTLNATMVQHNALLAGLAEKQGKATTTTDKPATTGKGMTGAKATETKPAETKPAISNETIAGRVGEYVGSSTKGSEEAKQKREAVKKLLAHFDTDKVANLKADKLVEFDGMLTQIIAGEDPFGGAEEDDDSVL